MVIECKFIPVASHFMLTYLLQALNNSETIRLLTSIELACYRCKSAVQDARLHNKGRRKIERIIKDVDRCKELLSEYNVLTEVNPLKDTSDRVDLVIETAQYLIPAPQRILRYAEADRQIVPTDPVVQQADVGP